MDKHVRAHKIRNGHRPVLDEFGLELGLAAGEKGAKLIYVREFNMSEMAVATLGRKIELKDVRVEETKASYVVAIL